MKGRKDNTRYKKDIKDQAKIWRDTDQTKASKVSVQHQPVEQATYEGKER